MKNNLRHDFDEELDNDTVWNLLEKSSPSEASPTFLQDTLRRTRLEASVSTPWWSSLFSPKLLLGTSAAALAAIALVFSLNSPTLEVVPSVASDSQSPAEEWNDLEDALASELLVSVTEVPSLLSDEEIVALIF